jgi:hypothetical protein
MSKLFIDSIIPTALEALKGFDLKKAGPNTLSIVSNCIQMLSEWSVNWRQATITSMRSEVSTQTDTVREERTGDQEFFL